MCKCTWTFLSIKQPHFLSSVFSLFWRENFLVSPRRKHPSPIISFPFSPPNQTHSKKVFIHIFSPKFSIDPISPPNKYTLNDPIMLMMNQTQAVGVDKLDIDT